MRQISQYERSRESDDTNERRLLGILTIGAPILMLVAALLHPPHDFESGARYFDASHDHSTRFYLSHTLFFLAATFFVPSTVGLARLVHPHRPRASFWGCLVTLVGFVGYAALNGIDFMTYVAGLPDTGLDPTVMLHFTDIALHTPAVLVPVLGVVTLLPVGLAVLGAGLASAGLLPRVLAALMPIGMVGLAASLQYPVLLVASALALLVGFGAPGLQLVRGSRAATVRMSTAEVGGSRR